MVDLGTLANLAEILGAVVVGGVGFALVQIGLMRRQRKDSAAFEFLRSIATAELRNAYPIVLGLPEGQTGKDIEAQGPTTTEAIETLNWTCEIVGLMVHERAIALGTVDKMMGGLVRLAWQRSSPYLAMKRHETGNGAYAEWFQWLAEQLGRHGNSRKLEGAHILYRNWRP